MDRDTLKNRLISTFLYIMDNEEFDDEKKMDLVALMYEVALEYDPAVMAEGLSNYLIARH